MLTIWMHRASNASCICVNAAAPPCKHTIWFTHVCGGFFFTKCLNYLWSASVWSHSDRRWPPKPPRPSPFLLTSRPPHCACNGTRHWPGTNTWDREGAVFAGVPNHGSCSSCRLWRKPLSLWKRNNLSKMWGKESK